MNGAIIDTNIISAFLKGNTAVIDAVTGYLKRHKRLSFSIITYYELARGFKALGSEKKLAAFQAFSAHCEIIPLSQPIADIAANIYATLKLGGNLIEDADMLIAATALSRKMSLVTDNVDHFQRVNGLKLYNWLR